MNHVTSGCQVTEEVASAVGARRRGDRSRGADHLRRGVEMKRDTIESFVGFSTAVSIRIVEDEVTDPHRAIDPDVNGQVHPIVDRII